ncbi:MAG: hypothetical protein HY334_04365 [Armatimonadetes bacterium]|nr:hypothetical protein [Armatimonadota bacterium]
MDTTMCSSLAHLSDQELVARLTHLAADERHATAVLIAHLAELDARRLYLAEGYSSLFTYCTQLLRLSEHAAYGRIEAARAARKFPARQKLADTDRPRRGRPTAPGSRHGDACLLLGPDRARVSSRTKSCWWDYGHPKWDIRVRFQ